MALYHDVGYACSIRSAHAHRHTFPKLNHLFADVASLELLVSYLYYIHFTMTVFLLESACIGTQSSQWHCRMHDISQLLMFLPLQ